MGVYLNPGKQYFETVANSEIFVDKTEMIMHLNSLVNTLQRYVCVTRPRGFVKTMAADMICAYYDREAASRDLFKKLKLAGCAPLKNRTEELSWDVYLGRFDVIHMVMTEFFQENKTVTEALDNMQQLVIRDIKKAYPDKDYFNDKDLIQTIEDIYSEGDRQVVIVIDEWDAIFRRRPNDKDGQTEYLDFL